MPLGTMLKLEQLKKQIESQETKIQNQENKTNIQEKKIQNQDNIIQIQGKQIQDQGKKIEHQEKKLQNQETKIQNQENKTNIQEKKIRNQDNIIQIQEKKIQEQGKKIQGQDNKINIHENKLESQEKKIESQGNMIRKLEKQYQDIVKLIDRLHSPTSCSALLIKHPSTRSGMYYINPKGLSSPPLVQVYCDMTSKNRVGVTVIGHDSESRTLVKGYDPAGSYKRKVKYDISMEHIVAIMKQSKRCEQFIKYECQGRLLWHLGLYYGWWVSRQGTKMNYWGGAAVNSGKCACGMTNSCASGGKCNCDKNDAIWREDSGYLTDKNTLPVTELRFGDTGHPSEAEKGYHTLGKLQCWG
ncbi:Hypothetical predicted protein [Paramuricea clavata]|uniref:Uncharacterized protein n=1 Tax=Paramuricea clavata TaxID=317549 RepID=A0A6S7I6D8_PARCT|nr:Hypothetical predicted protein [Paramuricea clavata]